MWYILASVLLVGLFGGLLFAFCSNSVSFLRLSAVILVLAAVLLMIIHLLRQVYACLRWFEKVLDALPVPVALLDERMTRCLDNKASQKCIREIYTQTPLFQEIPDGHAIAEPTVWRMEHRGGEYRISLTPVIDGNLVCGYVAVFQNIQDLVEDCKSRSALIDEVNRLMIKLHVVSTDFITSSSALADCTKRQAESLYTVASIVNDAVMAQEVTPEGLVKLKEAVNTINLCINTGSVHAGKISEVARHIVNASYSLNNTAKTMKNILG